jgi:hypothetical protein
MRNPLSPWLALATLAGCADSSTGPGSIDAGTVTTEAGSHPADAGPQDDAASMTDAAVAPTAADASSQAPRDAAAMDAASLEAGQGMSADAGRAEAGIVEAIPSACLRADLAYCEGFESAPDGGLAAGWSVLWQRKDAVDPVVVTSEAHTGKGSLKSGRAPSNQPHAVHDISGLGPLRAKHWGRVYFKAKAPIALPAKGAVVHNTIVALQGDIESRVVDTVIDASGAHQFLYNVPDDSVGIGTAYDYHAYDGAWHCAEWYVDQSTQTYRFFYEGKEASFVQGKQQTPKLEVFRGIIAGFVHYQTPSAPYEGYIDDLALDEARIGCE